MGKRYRNSRILVNASEYYKPLRTPRGLRAIRHFETPIIYHPTIAERASVNSTKYIWKYGDRLYNLAHQYYGDANYWWVIAWYNGYCTEANIFNGAVLFIPISLKAALKVLGV
jgi:hypothetical protein